MNAGHSPAHALAASRKLLLLEDVDLIMDCVRPLRFEPLVLDLGAGSGTSALSVFSCRPDAYVITVDNNPTAIQSTEELLHYYGHRNRWIGIFSDSAHTGAIIPQARERDGVPWPWGHRFDLQYPLDALLIDSSHEYEHTRNEINNWLPYVRPGAPVWFHDYDAEEATRRGLDAYPGVARAVDPALADQRLRGRETRGLGFATVKL